MRAGTEDPAEPNLDEIPAPLRLDAGDSITGAFSVGSIQTDLLIPKDQPAVRFSSEPDTEISLLQLRLQHGASELVLDKVVTIMRNEFTRMEDDLVETALGEPDLMSRFSRLRRVFASAYDRVGRVATVYRRRMWLEAQLGPSVC